MIISRSPLRISIGGGGTDLPSYYKEREGFVLSAAINKYIYVSVSRPFNEGIFLKYSKLENVKKAKDINHPILREALLMMNLKSPQIEITSIADIPSGTGLGSSGSFTTALLKGLYTHRRKHLLQEELAELACKIEIDKLKEPIGKQDQYIAAYGGITSFTFHKDNKVSAEPLAIGVEEMYGLQDRLLLFFTGYSRSASKILKDQNTKTLKRDTSMLKNLDFVKDLGIQTKNVLEKGDLNGFGEIMHEHWLHKKRRSKGMTNESIDKWYNLARRNGAIGGKVVGAGGGGFLMFLASDVNKLRSVMKKEGLEEVRFNFDFEGTKIISS